MDGIRIIERRLQSLSDLFCFSDGTVLKVGAANQILLQFLKLRLSFLTDNAANLNGETLPCWYLANECKADSAAPWRIASAVERLGRTLLVPVQILHRREVVQCALGLRVRPADVRTAGGFFDRLAEVSDGDMSPEIRCVGDELIVRLSKFRSINNRLGRVRLNSADSLDYRGLNLYEDFASPELLFDSCKRFLAAWGPNPCLMPRD